MSAAQSQPTPLANFLDKFLARLERQCTFRVEHQRRVRLALEREAVDDAPAVEKVEAGAAQAGGKTFGAFEAAHSSWSLGTSVAPVTTQSCSGSRVTSTSAPPAAVGIEPELCLVLTDLRRRDSSRREAKRRRGRKSPTALPAERIMRLPVPQFGVSAIRSCAGVNSWNVARGR